ncbi:glycosyltransferase family 2 protein [Polymorphobacter fuscus]|uniref:Glycosyltransferase n=1 Tax=Sandarakinorhabdus fusca TaxID=1439888 RepID=A0A7C9GPV6_9SPHN|nr:glycosyltransferase family 2 protein [Polymorphobacter fuscus]KAB7647916.1 glycosyltransferase family 2 protein [Polymorphobacter fuscus]MQT17233.1 glycosyltransferase [Polymorphobacter fuscus]NJC08773.1 succinoglycan biosynthesis protein ExoW [Polymorphobacter fuscus]
MEHAGACPKVAVIIPFYQATHGLLAAAVGSVAAQRVAPGTAIDIIVIDDGSPVSAASETLADLPPHCRLRVIAQRNAGVAAARNAGLDAVSSDTRFVAFLDSDDIWLDGHLAAGLAALTGGADLYFDNTDNCDGTDQLSSSKYLRERHGRLDPRSPIVGTIEGRAAFDTILSEHMPQTSQVMYDFHHHAATRFEEALKLASEDYLFWLCLANRSRRLSYCTGIMGRRGRGVSIYRSTMSWDEPRRIARVVDQINMRRIVAARFRLDAQQVKRVDDEIAELCDHVTFLAVRNSYRHPLTIVAELRRLTGMYPGFWRRVPAAIVGLPTIRSRLLQG